MNDSSGRAGMALVAAALYVDAQPVQDVMPTITGQKRAGGQW